MLIFNYSGEITTFRCCINFVQIVRWWIRHCRVNMVLTSCQYINWSASSDVCSQISCFYTPHLENQIKIYSSWKILENRIIIYFIWKTLGNQIIIFSTWKNLLGKPGWLLGNNFMPQLNDVTCWWCNSLCSQSTTA